MTKEEREKQYSIMDRNMEKELMKESSFYLFYVGTIKIQKKINLYRKLLKSDKYFSKEDYEYFGGKIYEFRLLRKQIAEDQARRLLNKLKKFTNETNKTK